MLRPINLIFPYFDSYIVSLKQISHFLFNFQYSHNFSRHWLKKSHVVSSLSSLSSPCKPSSTSKINPDLKTMSTQITIYRLRSSKWDTMAILPWKGRYENGRWYFLHMWCNVLYRHGADFLEFSKNGGET